MILIHRPRRKNIDSGNIDGTKIGITHSTDAKFTDISVNNIGSNTSNLKILTDASFEGNVVIKKDLTVEQDVSINNHLIVPDASLQNISVSNIYGNSPINLMHSTGFHENTKFLKNVDICNGGILNVSDVSLVFFLSA